MSKVKRLAALSFTLESSNFSLTSSTPRGVKGKKRSKQSAYDRKKTLSTLDGGSKTNAESMELGVAPPGGVPKLPSL